MEDMLTDIYVEPKLASMGSRFGAALLDFIILLILFVLFGMMWGETRQEGGSWSIHLEGAPMFLFMMLGFLLVPLQEGVTGKTLGKRVMGIRVVRKDCSEISPGRGIARHFFDAIDWCFIGLIVALTNPFRQRLGDLVADTIVVKD